MLNLNNAEFIRSAAAPEDIPRGLPQVVFAGRSNVGKSSVINCILGRKSLARTSSVPGKTANINLYGIDKKLIFTDLPGYGYAKVSQGERERWGKLMESYFSGAQKIYLGILVVDIRHKPTDDDVAMAELFRRKQTPLAVCVNKCDKIPKSQLNGRVAEVIGTLGVGAGDAVCFSAVRGVGKSELLSKILSAVKSL